MPAPVTFSPWAALLPAALAGTRRQPLVPLPGLTPSLGAEAGAAEKELLLTAANLRLVERAGTRPAGGAAPLAGRAPAEAWLPMPAAAARLFEQAVAGDAHHQVFCEFTELLDAHRRRLPHYLLPRQAQRPVYFRGYAGWNYGGRGLWLATLRLDQYACGWAHAALARSPPPGGPAGPSRQLSWLTDGLTARQLTELGDLLARHPWISQGPLPAAYEPWLEELRAQGHPHATAALLRIEDSELARRYWAYLAPLLELRADPAAPGGRSLHVQLPTPEWAAAWEEQQLRPSRPPTNGRLSALGTWRDALRFVSPARLLAAWQLDAAEVLELGCRACYHGGSSPYDQPADPADEFLRSMAAATDHHAHPDMALAILRYLARHPRHPYCDQHRLSRQQPLLPAAELLAWLHGRLPRLPAPPLVRYSRDAAYTEPPWFNQLEQVPALPGLLPMLLPFLQAHFHLPPDPAQEPLSLSLAKLVYDIGGWGDPATLLPWLAAELTAGTRPPALAALLEQARATLRLRHDLAASLTAGPALP